MNATTVSSSPVIPAARNAIELAVDSPTAGVQVARALRQRERHEEAILVYDELIRRFPEVTIPVLAEAHDAFMEMPQNRYRLYVSRYFDFGIQPGETVLDIGSGHDPFPFATHLADKSLRDDTLGRAGARFARLGSLPVSECDVEDMGCFDDGAFDFIHCSHVLEHTADPGRACRELMRVGRRGYIETPTRGKDLFLDTAKISNHRWGVEQVHGVLRFTEYTEQDVTGFECDVLMRMHCAPQSVREKAFAALVLLRAHVVNTMVIWQGSFPWEVHWRDGRTERSSDVSATVPARQEARPVEAPVAEVAGGAPNPNTATFYDQLYGGTYAMGEVALDWDYEAGNRMDWYRRVAALPFFQAAGRYLDVGCGLGGLFEVLPPGERELFGIDFSAVAIERAAARHDGTFVVGRAEALPFAAASFERISCTETLEHVDEPEAVVAAMAEALAPGGKLLITVPEATLDLHDHEWPGGVSLHINSFTVASLSSLVERHGLWIESAVIDEREIWMVAQRRS